MGWGGVARVAQWVAGGLVMAALCLALAIPVIGMGHGWELPLRYGALSVVLWPLAMLRWGAIGEGTPWRRDAALSAGVAAPLLLLLALVSGDLSLGVGGALALLAGVAASALGAALARRWPPALWGDGALLAVGIALDWAAVAGLVEWPEDRRLAAMAAPFVAMWLVPWLGWQALTGAALARRVRG